MEKLKNIFNIQDALVISARSYFLLLNREIIINSASLNKGKGYRLRFNKSNFLHLTGLKSSLSTNDFFNKCYSGNIEKDDYYLGPHNDRKTIKRKLKVLMNIGCLFEQKIYVQENFVKNNIICNIAASDGKCTIGFINTQYYSLPKTLLANNHLSSSKPIYEVSPMFKKITHLKHIG